MKRIKPIRNGQERYWHWFRIYSIVDLTVMPDNRPDGMGDTEWEAMKNDFARVMKMGYDSHCIEVAQYRPFDKFGVDVLGRFKTWEEARSFVKKRHLFSSNEQI